ncbi:MAG TPA: hypothetical protein VN408_04250 [Actinoplanes sp.]|nr:hypothetical protein [Actinoplanes sp.]
MTATDSGERLSLRRQRRWAYDLLIVGGVLPPVLVFTGAMFLHGLPFDYLWIPRLAAVTAWIWVLLVLPAFVLRMTLLRRKEVTLTPEGIQNSDPAKEPVPWSNIVDLKVVWRPAGYGVRVLKEWGPPVLLYAPRSGWLPDRRFHQDVAELRELAIQRGAPINAATPPRPQSPLLAVGLIIAVVFAATVARIVPSGAVWPWTSTASTAPDACVAADAAGLEQYWPARLRVLTAKERYEDAGSRCEWLEQNLIDEFAPYRTLDVRIGRFSSDGETSGVAQAFRDFKTDRMDETKPRTVPDLGDEAYLATYSGQVRVQARKANVTVTVTVDFRAGKSGEAESQARALTEGIIHLVRRDTTEG